MISEVNILRNVESEGMSIRKSLEAVQSGATKPINHRGDQVTFKMEKNNQDECFLPSLRVTLSGDKACSADIPLQHEAVGA